MCAEGLLLGSRELRYLARAYIGNIVVFLTALFFVARNRLGLRAVWAASS